MSLATSPGKATLVVLDLLPGRRGRSMGFPDRGDPSSHPLTLNVTCSPDEVLQKFSELATVHNHSIPKEQLQEFVQSHFQPVGQELQSWTPEDWKDRYCSGGKTGEGPSLGAASRNPVGPSLLALSSCRRSRMLICVSGRRSYTRSGKSWERR